ncbi:MAG: YicC family protein [Burkholderiaceae bacterium]|nr:YicC family protein [Burkholderiaceae bacterium]
MTGYATATRETAAGTLTLEIRSVNSRFLDLQFRLNDDLRAIEPLLREALMKQATRGKIECRLSLGRKAETGTTRALNAVMLNELARFQDEIRGRFIDATPMSVNELLRWPGVIEDAEISQETLQAEVQATMAEAIDAFIASRAREGAALTAMLLDRVSTMEAIVARIEPLIPQIVTQFQQKSLTKMQEALGLAAAGSTTTPSLTRDEAMERIRQEVTLYGIRIDVSEELSRMKAHLAETRTILQKGGQSGKRLDFMMQELNREANTLGSKATVKEVSDASMELKLLIEQMREQVQNLE